CPPWNRSGGLFATALLVGALRSPPLSDVPGNCRCCSGGNVDGGFWPFTFPPRQPSEAFFALKFPPRQPCGFSGGNARFLLDNRVLDFGGAGRSGLAGCHHMKSLVGCSGGLSLAYSVRRHSLALGAAFSEKAPFLVQTMKPRF